MNVELLHEQSTQPTVERIKIAVVGAGAMGGYFAGRLAERGIPVTLIDVDEERVSAIASKGLRIEDDHGDRRVPIAASAARQLSEPFDLIIIFTKSMQTASAAESVRHLVSNSTWFLTLQNGLGNPEIIQSIYPGNRVVMGITDVPADLIDHAHVRSHGKGTVSNWTLDGRPSDCVERVRALIEGAGIPTKADPNIRVAIWEKVSFNAAMNPVTALINKPVGGLENPAGRALIRAIVDEAVATAHAAGVAVDRDRIFERIDNALAHHKDHEPSMLQDMRAGRQTEIEAINGAVVSIGEAHGVPVPVNRTIVDLIRIAQMRP